MKQLPHRIFNSPREAPQRAVICFGPDHAPLDQCQVALALEEAHTLVPKPRVVVFAIFQFDPGEHGRVAVKIVDDHGVESLKIVEIE